MAIGPGGLSVWAEILEKWPSVSPMQKGEEEEEEEGWEGEEEKWQEGVGWEEEGDLVVGKT